jgi:all-trans-retinol 13,14-reductase
MEAPAQPLEPSSKPARPASDRSRRAHQPLPERVDVAIVGAGLGGLTAGAYLARRGLKVAVFESHYEAGGCATQFSRGGKGARYHFDVGLHYVGDCAEGGTIPRILGELGTGAEFATMDPDGFDTLVFPDLTFRIPASLELYRERLVKAFPHERRGIDQYVSMVRSVMNVGRVLEHHEGRPPLRALAGLALDGLRLAKVGGATMAELFDGRIRDPKLRAVILGQSGDYGLPPSKVSALLHMGLAGHYFRGAFYPKGGGQVIADRIGAALEAAGGSIHLRTPVEQILVRGGEVVGLRLAAKAGAPAKEVRAGVVLSNADLKRTLLELVGPAELPSDWVTRGERLEMAAALFIHFLGIEGDLRALGMSSTNVWQFDGYDVESFYRADKGEGPIQIKGCYVTSASLKDPDNARHHAPAGVGNVEIMCVVPGSSRRWGVTDASADAWQYKHQEAYEQRKRELERELVARLEALYPGAAERVVFSESASPITHRRFTGATDGTGYGIAATPAQFMKRRPGYRGPLAGLYLAGASTRAGHGVVGAMMGGRSAALRILRDVASDKVTRTSAPQPDPSR